MDNFHLKCIMTKKVVICIRKASVGTVKEWSFWKENDLLQNITAFLVFILCLLAKFGFILSCVIYFKMTSDHLIFLPHPDLLEICSEPTLLSRLTTLLMSQLTPLLLSQLTTLLMSRLTIHYCPSWPHY